MPAGGPTAIRGFNFQFAASGLQIVSLIREIAGSTVTFEGPADCADFSAIFEDRAGRISFQFKTRVVGNWTPSEIRKIVNQWLDFREVAGDQLVIQVQGLPGPALKRQLVELDNPNRFAIKSSICSRKFDLPQVTIHFSMPDTEFLINSIEAKLHEFQNNPALYRNLRSQSNELLSIISGYSELATVESRTVSIESVALKIGIVRTSPRRSSSNLNFNGESPSRKALVNKVLAFTSATKVSNSGTSNRYTTMILHGPSGIGKSHLRREIARRVELETLRVAEFEPERSANTLETLISAVESIGAPVSRIISIEEAITALHLLLTNYDVFICDNLEDDGALKAIDSIAGNCKVIVLRMSSKAIDGIALIPIRPLERNILLTCIDAQSTNGKRCARVLDAWCMGWPILITFMIAQLDTIVDSGMTIDDACEILSADLAIRDSVESQNLNDKLGSLLTQPSSNISQLDLERLTVLCCLERPVSIDAPLLELVWHLDPKRTVATLGRLTKQGLIFVDSGGVDLHDAMLAAVIGIGGPEVIRTTHQGILTSCQESKTGREYLQQFGAIHEFAVGNWWTCAQSTVSKVRELNVNPSLPLYLESIRILNKVLRMRVSSDDGSLLAWSFFWALKSSLKVGSVLSSVDAALSAHLYGADVVLASLEDIDPQVSATILSSLVANHDGSIHDAGDNLPIHRLLQALSDSRLSPISEASLTSYRRLASYQPRILPSLGELANNQIEQMLGRSTPTAALYYLSQLGLLFDPQFFNVRGSLDVLLTKYTPEELADDWSIAGLSDDLTRRLITTIAIFNSDKAALFAEQLSDRGDYRGEDWEVDWRISQIVSGNVQDILRSDSLSMNEETLRDVVMNLARQQRFREAVELIRYAPRSRWWCGTLALLSSERHRLCTDNDAWERGIRAALRIAGRLNPLSGLEAYADIAEVLVRIDREWATAIASQCLSKLSKIDSDSDVKLRLEKRLTTTMLRAEATVDKDRIVELLRHEDVESRFGPSWESGSVLRQVLSQAIRILPPKLDASNVDLAMEFLVHTDFIPTKDFWSALGYRYVTSLEPKIIRASILPGSFGDAHSREAGIVADALLTLAGGAGIDLMVEVASRNFTLWLDSAIAMCLHGASAPPAIPVESSDFGGLTPAVQIQLAIGLYHGEVEFATRLFVREYSHWLSSHKWGSFAARFRRPEVLSPVLAREVQQKIQLHTALQLFRCDDDDVLFGVSDFWSVLSLRQWNTSYSATSVWITKRKPRIFGEDFRTIATFLVNPFLHRQLLSNRADVIRQILSLSLESEHADFSNSQFSLTHDQFFEIVAECLRDESSSDPLCNELRIQVAESLRITKAYNGASVFCLVMTAPRDSDSQSEFIRMRVDHDDITLVETICTALKEPAGPLLIDQVRRLYDQPSSGDLYTENTLRNLSDYLRPDELFKYLDVQKLHFLVDSNVILDFIENPGSIAMALRQMIDVAATNATCDDIVQYLDVVNSFQQFGRAT